MGSVAKNKENQNHSSVVDLQPTEFEDFENLNIKDQITLTKQVKLLTMPDKMGYTFKCLLLTKNFSSKHEIHHNGDRSYAL